MPSLKMSEVSMPPSVMKKPPSSCGKARWGVMRSFLEKMDASGGRRRGGARHEKNVALRMAAAQAMRHRRQGAQGALGERRLAAREGEQRPADRQPGEPRHLVVRAFF